jgi:transposase
MEIELENTEIDRLKKLHRKTKEGKKRDRIKAILMLADGHKVAFVAKVLLIDENTIYRWLEGYRSNPNSESWLTMECQGYDGKLTEIQEKLIGKYVDMNTINTSAEISEYIKKKWGYEYSHSGITAILKRLGYVYKKAETIPSKYNSVAQAAFKAAYDIVRISIDEEKTVILFMDGVHPQHNTRLGYVWVKKGDSKKISSNSGRQRVNINGVYNPMNQDIIVLEHDRINAEAIIKMIIEIEKKYPHQKEIIVYVDNAKYNRNKAVKEYLARSRVHFEYLPTYSPNLNVIERLWKVFHCKVTRNKYHETVKCFKIAVRHFFTCCDTAEYRKMLAKSVGYKMHLFTS